MKDERDNIVRFQPRPKAPPPPKKRPAKARPTSHRGGEPAINWSRAPRAAVLIVGILFLMWLVGILANWVSGIGVS
jgi:hypothetical protein